MKNISTVSFGIVIIESLNEFDDAGKIQCKTGSNLFNSLIKYKKFQEPELTTKLHTVNTIIEFMAVLDSIIYEVKRNNFFPILHIETHGSEDGMKLASGEIITWENLFSKTTELNILLKNSLLITLAMCSGTTIIGQIDPSQRAPFGIIVGTLQSINYMSLQIAFDEFYDHYFFSFSISESVEKMNTSNKNSAPRFDIITSKFCFDQIVDIERDPTNFQRMINYKANLLKATNSRFKKIEFNEIKKTVEIDLRLFFANIKNNRDFFLMKDL